MPNTLFRALIDHHQEIRTLVKDIKTECAKEPGQRDAVFCFDTLDTLRVSLSAHLKAEEDTLYALFEDMDSVHVRDLRDAVMEGREEHEVLDQIIEGLVRNRRMDDVWIAKFTVLAGLLLSHLEEEERTLFPSAKKVLRGREAELVMDSYLDRHEREFLKAQSASLRKGPLAPSPPTRVSP